VSRRSYFAGLLCPEREWCPLLTLLDAERAPRFRRPDRPAHAYAQTTRRDTRLQTQNATPAGRTRTDAA
jgi:hypothetical protein